ncbi:MAG TPA: c-type cytochrome [Bryobacteraceae bacterium]|nr:c-type cytochrome [Bryobacteraceae bacterium]
MRILVPLFLATAMTFTLSAQAPGGRRGKRPPPKNLKILTPQNYLAAMQSFRTALGVQCTFCHVQGDFASDMKPQKNIARVMLQMTRDINTKLHTAIPDSGNERLVSCYTCHRGSQKPLTEPPGGAAKQ